MSKVQESQLSPIENVYTELNGMLYEGELVENAYMTGDGFWAFTDSRIIIKQSLGCFGIKKEYHAIPYERISHFALETAGMLSRKIKLYLWIEGEETAYCNALSMKAPVAEIFQLISNHCVRQ